VCVRCISCCERAWDAAYDVTLGISTALLQ
jgi:hypothetical protein